MKRLLLLLFIVGGAKASYAQDQPKPVTAEAIKKMADDRKFRFYTKVAELSTEENRSGGLVSSAPTKANRISLTTTYSALLTPDSVVSYLPYFGKSTTDGVETNVVVVTTEEMPTKFTAKLYDYSTKQKKKGNVVITIQPNDSSKIEKYVFDLAPDGSAKLELTITNYKTIKYDGYFTAL